MLSEEARIERRKNHNDAIRKELTKYPKLEKWVNKFDDHDATPIYHLVSDESPDLDEIQSLLKRGAVTLFKNDEDKTIFECINPKAREKKIKIHITAEENSDSNNDNSSNNSSPKEKKILELTLEQYVAMCMIGDAMCIITDRDFLPHLLNEVPIYNQFDWEDTPVPNSVFWVKSERIE